MDDIKQLLKEYKEDNNKQYESEQQWRAVSALNDYYVESSLSDEYIWDTDSEEWKDICKQEIDNRGWIGVKYFLQDLDNTADYATIDAYGNARTADYDLIDKLELAIEENQKWQELNILINRGSIQAHCRQPSITFTHIMPTSTPPTECHISVGITPTMSHLREQ